MNPHIPSLYSVPRHRANIDHAKEVAMSAFERGQNYAELANAIAYIPSDKRTGAVQRLFSQSVHASREAFQLLMRMQSIPLFYDVESMETWCDETRSLAAKLQGRCDTAKQWLTYDPITDTLTCWA